MRNTRRIFAAAIGFMLASSAMPLSAGGNKDKTADESVIIEENDANMLRIVGDRPPAAWGEGGGKGASELPPGVSIDSGLVGEMKPVVAAETADLTGTLKVKGSKGKRTFTLKVDGGKNYALQVEESRMEDLAALKGKKLFIRGVFYGSNFLVFEYSEQQ
ncbi:MAG TPA: hypothetical protein DCZ74_00315 [Treponema sp.]|jgi:hypothetical protein|nr:hypothetical protein [Treponema sp.]